MQDRILRQLCGAGDADAVEACLQLGAAPLMHLTCRGHLPCTLPFTTLHSLTVVLPASEYSVHTVLRKQLHRMPLLQRLDVSFGWVACFLGEEAPFALAWLARGLAHALPSLAHIALSQLSRHGVSEWNPEGSNLSNAAMQHWWGIAELEENGAMLPQLASFSLDLYRRLDLSPSDPAAFASCHTVSVVQYDGSDDKKVITQRAAAYHTSRDSNMVVDSAVWGQAWDDLAAGRAEDETSFPSQAGLTPVQVSRAVQRFRKQHGLRQLDA